MARMPDVGDNERLIGLLEGEGPARNNLILISFPQRAGILSAGADGSFSRPFHLKVLCKCYLNLQTPNELSIVYPPFVGEETQTQKEVTLPGQCLNRCLPLWLQIARIQPGHSFWRKQRKQNRIPWLSPLLQPSFLQGKKKKKLGQKR